MSGSPYDAGSPKLTPKAARAAAHAVRVERLEREVAALRATVRELEARLAAGPARVDDTARRVAR